MTVFVRGHYYNEILNADDGVTNGADIIWALGGNDAVFGLGGADELKGGGGADTLNGGNGSDTATYADSDAGVTVSLLSGPGSGGTAEGDILISIENLTGSSHNDSLVGNKGSNVLSGLNGDDILESGGGADTLNGGVGNDALKGGGGADTLNGGFGMDTAYYNESPAGVSVSLLDDTASRGDAEGDELNSIENLVGSIYRDNLDGDDGVNVLNGFNGSDSLKGFGGADFLYGGFGDDYLKGGAGTDTMTGGIGNDTYDVDVAGDNVIEAAGAGTDEVWTSLDNYNLGANVENLKLTAHGDQDGNGNALANTIGGNEYVNHINGGLRDDTISGMHEDDTLNGGAGDDWLYGGDGDDTLSGAAGYDFLDGFDGVDTLNAGRDGGRLRGGLDNDTLNGGGDGDFFIFDTRLSSFANVDTVNGFNVAEDTIRIDNSVFAAAGIDGILAAAAFFIGAAAHDTTDRIIYDSGTGALFYDSDGTGAVADQVKFAQMATRLGMSNLDFEVI